MGGGGGDGGGDNTASLDDLVRNVANDTAADGDSWDWAD